VLAFEESFRVGENPVNADVIEAVLSGQIDDLEPRLMRHDPTGLMEHETSACRRWKDIKERRDAASLKQAQGR
jgi:hypothetical protein